MTKIFDEPATFAKASLAAFALAYRDRVAPVGSGVVRRPPAPGRVSIVTGGGAGHFPAFLGWVGRGLATAAVSGNIFSSPSEHQILEVARRADQGAGILFIPINYAGDILHFTAAAQQLNSESVNTRMVVVTDDIASGAATERHLRRGIAGSLLVVKIAGAAAERGYPLEDVERIALAANGATRSFGVAFSGCTLPGEESPLFTVPAGRMAIGMGIHGEPGIDERDLGSAADVAKTIVDGLFNERPAVAGQRVAVLVNGLGATKYDELNLVFGHVRDRLHAAGMTMVAPVVGEYVTSLDMAGLSVSIAYLDDELNDLWRDPADSVAYTRSRIADIEIRDEVAGNSFPAAPEHLEPGTSESRAAAQVVTDALRKAATAIDAQASRLGEIDAIAGDGDHGMGMQTGIGAALIATEDAEHSGAGVGTQLDRAGSQWSDVAGGTSGALWGAGLRAAGQVLGDHDEVTPARAAQAVVAFGDAISARGGAVLGEKTMLDAILPFATALSSAIADGMPLGEAWRLAAREATAAADATAQLTSSRGRSRIYGAHTIGTPDAGAISFAVIVESVL